jgi:uncharacterized membrane-anchored protein YjiN (DUF445 family)
MSENLPQPKKPQRNKAKKVNMTVKKRWQDIVNDVDKNKVPVTVLQRIVVRLIDGTDLSIDIKQLIRDGLDESEIEEMLDEKFEDLDQYINNVDFFVDLDKVVNTVQPETDKVLKGL